MEGKYLSPALQHDKRRRAFSQFRRLTFDCNLAWGRLWLIASWTPPEAPASWRSAYFRPGATTRAEISHKEGGSPVTEADYLVDRFLKQRLETLLPEAGWLSEETEDTPARLSKNLGFCGRSNRRHARLYGGPRGLGHRDRARRRRTPALRHRPCASARGNLCRGQGGRRTAQ